MNRRNGSVAPLVLSCVLAACADDRAELARYLAEGREHLSRRHYDPALAAFDKVLAIDPTHFDARRLEAEILYNTGQLDRTATLLDGLLAERPADPDLVWAMAMVRKDQKRFAASLLRFESLPPSRRPPLAMAEVLSGVGRHDEAAVCLGRFLVDSPWDPQAYYLLSRIEFRRGREASGKAWGRFFRSHDVARRVEGQSRGYEYAGQPILARTVLARSLLQRGRWFEARAELRRAVQQDPRAAQAWLMLGLLSRDVGDCAAAIAAFDRILAIQPDEPNATRFKAEEQARVRAAGGKTVTTLQIARRFAAAGQPAFARAAALFAAQRDPKDVAAQRLVARLFDRPEDAFVRLWALRRALALAPGDTGLQGEWRAGVERLGIPL